MMRMNEGSGLSISGGRAKSIHFSSDESAHIWRDEPAFGSKELLCICMTII